MTSDVNCVNIKLNILRENNYINIKVLPELVKNGNSEFGRLGISPLIEEKEILENKIKVKFSLILYLHLVLINQLLE